MSWFKFKTTDAMRRMLQAREKVARKNPFFASILFGAQLIESKKHKTVWTDGLNIYFNPDFVLHPEAEPFIEGVLLHDVLHCAMLHIGRKKWREPKKWNEACDYSVNPVVEQYFKLPDGSYRDKRFDNLSPEAIYEILEVEEQKQPKSGKGQGKGKSQPAPGKGNGKGQPDPDGDGGEDDDQQNGEGQQSLADMMDGEQPGTMHDAPSPEEQEEAEREWKRALSNAIEKSQKAGTMPGNIQRLVDQLFPKEKVDWKELLRDMSRDAKAKTSRTWSRPNRRRLGGGEYMPGYGHDAIYRLVICFDVSGSVDHNMHKAMREEVANLLDQNLINRLTVMAVDTEVHNETDVKTSEELEAWAPRGGGGTDFRSAMKRVGEMEDVIGCLFLTDMATNSFGDDPGVSCVWVDWTGGGHTAPYGRVVAYK